VDHEEEIRRINAALDELLDRLADALQSGEEIDDDLQGEIANEIDQSLERINYLQNEIQVRERPEVITPEVQTMAIPSDEAQLLWILSGQQEQAFISYLRTFGSPASTALLNNPLELSRVMEQLEQLMPSGQPPQVLDGIPHADLQSSNVWGVSYDQKSSRLKVRFQGGSIYEYNGVPANIFRAFVRGNAAAKTEGHNQYGAWWRGKNPSLGAALNQYIKASGFTYRKIR